MFFNFLFLLGFISDNHSIWHQLATRASALSHYTAGVVALWRCGSLRLTDLAASKIRRP
jgi:hypothetical protein